MKIFINFSYLYKTQPGQKTAGNFPIFFEDIYLPDPGDPGYPGLDAALKTSRFGGDIAFPIGKIGRGLPSLALCHCKSGDITS